MIRGCSPLGVVDSVMAMLTLAEAAAWLGQSERQVRYLIQQGKLQATKLGRRWMISKEAVRSAPRIQRREAAKLEALEGVVRDVLDLPVASVAPRWTVTTMRAVGAARRAHAAVSERFGPEGPAPASVGTWGAGPR